MPAPVQKSMSNPTVPLIYSWLIDEGEAEYVRTIGEDLRTDPNFLMAAMYFETAGTFDPAVRNKAGSGGTGLIQFMPPTAEELKTTTAALAAMTRLEQLLYVRKYMNRYRARLHTVADVYMAILWPRAVGQPDSHVLFDRDDTPAKLYIQNKGLDLNRDGVITKAEAAAKVVHLYQTGLEQLKERLAA